MSAQKCAFETEKDKILLPEVQFGVGLGLGLGLVSGLGLGGGGGYGCFLDASMFFSVRTLLVLLCGMLNTW
jgi:hypothetical protein